MDNEMTGKSEDEKSRGLTSPQGDHGDSSDEVASLEVMQLKLEIGRAEIELAKLRGGNGTEQKLKSALKTEEVAHLVNEFSGEVAWTTGSVSSTLRCHRTGAMISTSTK